MSLWSIIIPEATTNMVTNPSVELATTGYTAVGGSVARSATNQRRGVYSLAVTPTAGTTDGVYFGTVTVVNGQDYTFSADVLGVAGVPYRIYFASTAGSLLTSVDFVGTGKWQRVSVTRTENASTTRRLYITKNTHASTGVFYVDGLQCENKSYATTYIDGDQAGGEWTGAVHGSTSTRDEQQRNGGREYNLDSDYELKVRFQSGGGMPFGAHLTQEQAMIPGAAYRGSKVKPRMLTLTIAAPVGPDESASRLHVLRRQLVEALKPDLVADETQPVILRYTGASTEPLEISAVYDSGLEMNAPQSKTEEFDLRFICYDPFWREVGNRAALLTTAQSVANANYIIQKANGTWSAFGTGMSGTVYGLKRAPNGNLYACGYFATAGGVTVNNLGIWNGTAWAALSSGTNGTVRKVAFDADGNPYIVGDFTHAGGNLVNYVAEHSGVNWSAIDGGTNATVMTIAVGSDGLFYIGGAFSNAGSVAAARVARLVSGAWTAMGAGMSGGTVLTMVWGRDGYLYAGGSFTAAVGIADTAYIARWNGTAWETVGGGANNQVFALAAGKDGSIYAGGIFTTIGGVSASRVARWNGASWEPLGSGVNDQARSIAVDDTGLLYVGGDFTTAGGLTVNRIAAWNGSSWCHLDATLPGTPIIYEINTERKRLVLGFDTNGTATTSGVATVNNAGTRTAYPKISITRSGGTGALVKYIKNETNDKTLWLNRNLMHGETLTIDLNPHDKKITSSFHGDLPGAVFRNSNLGAFTLLPGDNVIGSFVTVTSGVETITASVEWVPLHWSHDGAAA